MSFPAYPDYQRSEMPWVGMMPTHWRTERLKSLFALVKRPPRDADGIVTAFRNGQVTLRSNRREDGFTNALQEIGYQGVRSGDLVIHAMDAFAGAVGVSDSDGKSSPVYSVCVPRADANPRYFGLAIRYMALSGFINSLAKGIRERSTEFRWADASVQPFPVPSLGEQNGIMAFLDRETAKIDLLIEQQRRLIALLKEKQQAVISYAVTNGRNPHVPMKDSRIKWLGEVPAHWKIVPAKRVADVFVPQRNKPDLNESSDGLPWVTMEDMEKTDIADTRMYVSQQAAGIAGCRPLPANSVVASCVGNFGSAAINRRPVYINQQIQGYIVHDVITPDFLRIVVAASTGYFEKIATAATLPYVNKQGFANMPVPLPPLSEQQEIVAHQIDSGARIDMLLATVGEAVLLLNERRAALISAAVTGKIDVRRSVSSEAREAA